MVRPRAADDFPAIRARMEELRRERAGVLADDEDRRPNRLRPYAISNRPGPSESSGLSPELRRALLRGRVS